MDKRRLSRSDIAVGQTLPWDVYDADGHLLLRRGLVLDSHHKVDALLERGLFAQAEAPHARHDTLTPTKKNALALILEARQLLKKTCATQAPKDDFKQRILGVVSLIEQACQTNQDVALASTLLHREGNYSIRHSVDSAVITHLLGGNAGMQGDELKSVTAAALTMNISMLDMQDALQGRAAPLTPEERDIIRHHPTKSAEMLDGYGVADPLWLLTLQDHHESISGVGYPAHKKGDDVLLPTRVVSLADVYCAKVSGRDYRAPMRPNEAMRSLYLDQGGSVETFLAAQLIKSLGVYPAGTPVRLRNGEIAIVIRQGGKANIPIVCSIISAHGNRMDPPMRRDTANPAYEVQEVVTLSALGSHINMAALWGKEAAED